MAARNHVAGIRRLAAVELSCSTAGASPAVQAVLRFITFGAAAMRAVARHGRRLLIVLALGIVLVTASPSATTGAAILAPVTDDVVVQAGSAFTHGLGVNVVTTHGVQLAGGKAIRSPLPQYARFGSYTSVPVEAAHAFRMLNLAVAAVVPAHGLVTAAVRTALTGGPWSPWRDLGALSVSTPAIIQGPTATRWQYRLSLFAAALENGPQAQQVTVGASPLPAGYSTVPPISVTGPSYQVFATREGLVGGTTTNGRRIRAHDHFVALPSDTALNCDGCRDYTVTLSYQGRTTTAPVWDVGPWNTADAYWNEPLTPFRSLPQGVSQARAAYQKSYHSGQDAFGRTVSNPAGIDLADGVFWDDLHMIQSDWVTVTFNWETRRPGAVQSVAAMQRPYAAAWLSDRYEEAPARSITLTTGTRSDQITVLFRNLGTATWDAHTILAIYNPRDPTAPPAASPFCNPLGPDGQPDWATCAPGVPAFVGNGRPAGPGRSVPFVFYLKAPLLVGDTTVYLKVAQEVGGRYQWLNQPNGQESYDAIRVHVIPLPSRLLPSAPAETPTAVASSAATVPVSGTSGITTTVTPGP